MAAPVFNGLDSNPTYTENSSAVLLDNNASITDADIGALHPLHRGYPHSGPLGRDERRRFVQRCAPQRRPGDGVRHDRGFGKSGNFIVVEIIIGTYTNDDGTLVITFNDQATGDRITDVLRQLTYSNASDTPPSSIVVGYTFNNGDTATGSITVTINAVNDPPSIDALDGSALYQPGSGGVVLSPNISLSDFDSPTLSGAVVAFSGSFLGTDVLSANVGSTGIVANYAGGVLTLSKPSGGPATVEQYRQVLATVTYSTTVTDPTNGGAAPDRALNWFVTDSANADSPAINTTLAFGPGVDLDASGAGIGFATTFTQGGAAVAIADTDADITATFDAVSGVTVVLTNAKAGDALSATGGPLDVTVDNSQPGRITLLISGPGSETDYENALKSVTFSSSSSNIDPTTRDVTVTVADFGGNPSLAAHSAITINGAVNDPGSAADDTATVAANTNLFVPGPGVLANDNDPDGLVVVTGAVATSGGGAIEFQPNGAYSYTPAANFAGTDTVVYTAQDPFGSQVSATLRITVNAPPTPPSPTGTPGDDSFTASGNQQVNGGLGTDTVTFNFRLVDATVTYSGNQIIVDSGSTHTVLTGFEVFKFTDGTVNNNDADPLVDDLFYYAKYHDVWTAHVDADAHFHNTGWKEGRGPDAFFSTVDPSLGQPGREGRRRRSAGPLRYERLDAGPRTLDYIRSGGLSQRQPRRRRRRTSIRCVTTSRTVTRKVASRSRRPNCSTANGFDYVYYLNHNPDVAAADVDPFQHFQTVGWKEGRNPNALFDTTGYLNNYLDVKAANVNPLDHYNQFGWHEGRDPSVGFDTTSYLAAYADVNAAHVNPLAHFLNSASATAFDYVYYLQNNPDVAAAGVDPYQHFQPVGWKEGRNPNAFFDTAGYLSNYADVKAANVNPLDHYNQFGWHEGRDPSTGFDTTSYLTNYADVDAAHINPLTHFLQFGMNEGRSAFADGAWG